MLELVPDMLPSATARRNIDRKFLEPACGAGNFLVEILERKLAYVEYGSMYRSINTFETAVLRALSSLYGIDIDDENVEQSRHFLRVEIEHHMNMQLNSRSATAGFFPAVDVILATNVVQADTLKDAGQIKVIDYRWQRRIGYILREWSFLENNHKPQPDLFADPCVGSQADGASIHYSALMDHPQPTLASTSNTKFGIVGKADR